MIVADTNVLAYLLLPGEFTDQAEDVLAWDTDWHVPRLWRSEFRNVLVFHVRQKQFSIDEATSIMHDAGALVDGKEHETEDLPIVERALDIGCSAYDAEFLALAEHLECALVTADRKLVQRAPETARLLSDVAADS